jgi:hypothetical protein
MSKGQRAVHDLLYHLPFDVDDKGTIAIVHRQHCALVIVLQQRGAVRHRLCPWYPDHLEVEVTVVLVVAGRSGAAGRTSSVLTATMAADYDMMFSVGVAVIGGREDGVAVHVPPEAGAAFQRRRDVALAGHGIADADEEAAGRRRPLETVARDEAHEDDSAARRRGWA